jgi:hypothetical protein
MQDGTYRGRATGSKIDNQTGDVQFGVSGTGGEQIAARVEVTEGDARGERIWWIGSLVGGAVEITVRQLRDMGARLKDGYITDLEGLGTKEFTFTVKSEEWQGKTRQRVSIGGGELRFKNELDKGGLEALAARLRGNILGAGGKTPAGAAVVDDDIGF